MVAGGEGAVQLLCGFCALCVEPHD
jgi:hypothetical protein